AGSAARRSAWLLELGGRATALRYLGAGSWRAQRYFQSPTRRQRLWRQRIRPHVLLAQRPVFCAGALRRSRATFDTRSRSNEPPWEMRVLFQSVPAHLLNANREWSAS